MEGKVGHGSERCCNNICCCSDKGFAFAKGGVHRQKNFKDNCFTASRKQPSRTWERAAGMTRAEKAVRRIRHALLKVGVHASSTLCRDAVEYSDGGLVCMAGSQPGLQRVRRHDLKDP
uniref:Uncharacterized protein n=1 Tax=Eutreptiella gymnastica TaxID=73025 RepID=A0A7S4FW78_9EUGL